ncbi:hypothetical protein FOA43_002302 [Brettanomyces nanus]|uniref:Uncharacterized protein n=1 Tax=Eeniella nana TaxID=13502 RepID=A0A875S215_EENNA|nr:uncharacterized protein FOA43_002302 [Brettanomyces nanus]QPG74963.1 hypothetical protein FOA43_002302 [Brettanomyces nanus]
MSRPVLSESTRPSRQSFQHLTEYGPKINGYRFVATKPDEVIEEEILKEDNPDNRHYEDTPMSEIPESSYTYSTYNDLWMKITQSGKLPGFIPLPVETNSPEDLNDTNVARFIESKTRAKNERIRWHPDKMIVRLQKLGVTDRISPDYKRIVTRVFQIINRVYNNLHV